MKVKVILGNDIRRWRYTNESTLQSLNEFVASSFSLNTFWLQYEDEEGDRLTLSSQNDFEDALFCAMDEDRKSLKIYVIEGSLPSAQRKQESDSMPSEPPQPEQKSEPQPEQPNANNNCQQIKAAAIDFLNNQQIIALLPALHRHIFEAIKASKQQ